jgi:radical SAM superfamily enzyme YgiQ (UPF0313 family)
VRIDFYSFGVGAPVGYSLGVATLSGGLKQRGHTVRLSHVDPRLGLAWDLKALVEHTAGFAPDVVCVSFATNHAPHARALVAALAERLPGLRTIAGGVHPTFAAEEVLAWPGVTAVGRGECDGVLADFVDGWAAGEALPRVPNFWVRGPDGTIVRNPLGLLPPLDGVAPFDEDIDVAAFTRAGRGFGHVAVTRGCPYRCSYCFNQGIVAAYAADLGVTPGQVGYCRRRSVDDALAEVHRLQRLSRGELRVVNFDDDTLVADRGWFLTFAARLKAEIGLPYVTNATVDKIDAEIARALAASGCLLAKFGIESGSARVSREVLRRVQHPSRAEEAFRLLRAAGVNTRAYVMMGIPTETRAEALETFALCGRMGADTVRPAWFQPYPGTEAHALCLERGLVDRGQEIEPEPSASPLRWPPEHALFLRQLWTIHAWVLSAAQPYSPAAPVYGELAERVFEMDADTFDAPETAQWIRATTLHLDRRFRCEGVPHYLNPFPDRLDATFLLQPGRRHPFPNVEDAWPPDAPWRDEPLP